MSSTDHLTMYFLSDLAHRPALHAGSLMKVPVMLEDLAEEGEVRLGIPAEGMRMPPEVIDEAVLGRVRHLLPDTAQAEAVERGREPSAGVEEARGRHVHGQGAAKIPRVVHL